MKTTTIIAALTGIALFSFAGPVQAQYKTTGEDGITASPKHRQVLDEYNKTHQILPGPAEIQKMSCPKCKDRVTTRTDYTARGANKPVIQVVTHLCSGCGTEWKTTGHGRAKQSVATHTCTGCGAENMACCNITGSTIATKGMEKDITLAPLK